MRVLEKVKSSLVAGLDIETARLYEHYSDVPYGIKAAWEYKHRDKSEDEIESEWYESAALTPEFSKVVSISIVFLNVDSTKLYCYNYTDSDEHKLLSAFADMVNRIQKKNRGYTMIAHNGYNFDYPFLGKRFIINRIKIPKMLDTSGLKPWTQQLLCSKEIWKCGGFEQSSLISICAALGLEISKDDITGKEVGDVFYAGELERIGRYCDKDTVAVFNILRILLGESTFSFDEVVYKNGMSASKSTAQNTAPQTPAPTVAPSNDSQPAEIKGAEPPKPATASTPPAQENVPDDEDVLGEAQPVLARIYSSKEFETEDQDELKEILLDPKKKLNKKEIEYLKMTLTDCYVESAMFKADTKPVVAKKKKEVEDFIEEIITEKSKQ